VNTVLNFGCHIMHEISCLDEPFASKEGLAPWSYVLELNHSICFIT